MSSGSVIVIEIRSKDSAERGLVENDHLIQALPADGSNHALDVGSLPRRARGRKHFLDAQSFRLFHNVVTINAISIPQKIVGSAVPRKCLDQLLCRPLGRRMGGHME